MAKSREQMIQDQLGAMAFQIAVLAADLEEAREQIAAFKAEGEKAKTGGNIRDIDARMTKPVETRYQPA